MNATNWPTQIPSLGRLDIGRTKRRQIIEFVVVFLSDTELLHFSEKYDAHLSLRRAVS